MKGSRDSEGEDEMNSDEEDNETSSEDGNSESESASIDSKFALLLKPVTWKNGWRKT